MSLYTAGFYKILTFIFVALTAALLLPQFSPVIFPRLALTERSCDCDDATLAMYNHFREMGIEATPIVGNLELECEEYAQCNHVWLLVKSGDREIAYDWGTPRFDSQHYEGYTISLEYLLGAVREDFTRER